MPVLEARENLLLHDPCRWNAEHQSDQAHYLRRSVDASTDGRIETILDAVRGPTSATAGIADHAIVPMGLESEVHRHLMFVGRPSVNYASASKPSYERVILPQRQYLTRPHDPQPPASAPLTAERAALALPHSAAMLAMKPAPLPP